MDKLSALTDPERVAEAKTALELCGRPDGELDRFCEYVVKETAIPKAIVTLALRREVRTIGQFGLPRTMPRRGPARWSICSHVTALDRPVTIEEDAGELLEGCVALRFVKFYVGVPVHLGGRVVGALASIDTDEHPGASGRVREVLLDIVPTLERSLADRRSDPS